MPTTNFVGSSSALRLRAASNRHCLIFSSAAVGVNVVRFLRSSMIGCTAGVLVVSGNAVAVSADCALMLSTARCHSTGLPPKFVPGAAPGAALGFQYAGLSEAAGAFISGMEVLTAL